MFWLLVGSLHLGLVLSVRSSYRASRELHNAWPLFSQRQIELISGEETRESPEVYKEPSLENAEEAGQEAIGSLVSV